MSANVYTVMDVYRHQWQLWGFDVARWLATAKPSAELTQEPGEPQKQTDGSVITYYRTRFGKRFAQIVEPNGFVLWLQEVE